MNTITALRRAVSATHRRATVLALSLALGIGAASAQQVAQNFTVYNHVDESPLSLYGYQGNVILLDFWAYWCEYCQEASSDIEPNIAQYYQNAGGNHYGVPVTVLSISIDCSDPSMEDDYIQTFGLQLVADDLNLTAYSQFSDGYIPLLVVINGATNAVGYVPWQVLYCGDGYEAGYTVPLLRNYIDSVQTPPPSVALTNPAAGATLSPPNVPLTASVTTNGEIIKGVEFYTGATLIGTVTNTPYSLTWSNVSAGAHSVFAKACYGSSLSASSATVNFTVAAPVCAALCRQGKNLLLSWTGGTGNFQVQVTTNLNSGSWQNLGTAGPNASQRISPSARALFYRVVWQ